MKTLFIVQAFVRQASGKKTKLIADTPLTCSSAHEAENRAERMADKRAGVVAVSQEYDPDTGDYGKLIVLAQYGEIPEGLFGE